MRTNNNHCFQITVVQNDPMFVGFWWSSQPNNAVTSKGAGLSYNNTVLGYGHHYNDYGFSVRCIQN